MKQMEAFFIFQLVTTDYEMIYFIILFLNSVLIRFNLSPLNPIIGEKSNFLTFISTKSSLVQNVRSSGANNTGKHRVKII